MNVVAPVQRYPALRSRRGLIQWVVPGLGEFRSLVHPLGPVVPEPVLARLVALYERVTGRGGVRRRVLRGRRIAAPDVPALGAATQVHPPPLRGVAIDATRSARRHVRRDALDVSHVLLPPVR
ncbi:hypothetical protein RHCRD62_50113 [Rhodococcus sp. RD6.2]|nr:hypothetical protein RHCRD62_50113 [Rhodococcus sp. RD6.2]